MLTMEQCVEKAERALETATGVIDGDRVQGWAMIAQGYINLASLHVGRQMAGVATEMQRSVNDMDEKSR